MLHTLEAVLVLRFAQAERGVSGEVLRAREGALKGRERGDKNDPIRRLFMVAVITHRRLSTLPISFHHTRRYRSTLPVSVSLHLHSATTSS